ncbi:hypothetical protein H5410_052342 [Solanum commersonii]|uniref:DUF7745 domain-containing protein n=1 Tax=Solanum commersonii TaxID=4109 RepID=A0A9J5X0U7_SOLCO|nr:hypothetical protein H5410_052342 [Solanum commersonii]
MVAFLGTMVFPRRDKKNQYSSIENSHCYDEEKELHYILPMMLADIYCALTKCKEGEDFFEGCSMMKELVDKLPRCVKAWRHYLLKLTASDITWNYHWFPLSEVIIMSSYRPFFVLTGLRGFQPYIPLRVLRQLGQRQILPKAEDTQSFVWEVASEDRNREAEAQKIWGALWSNKKRSIKKEKVQLMCAQSKLQNQVKASVEREREIARRFSAYQAEYETERGQRIAERDALHFQIEELQEQGENLTHEVNTTRHWLQNCYDNMNEAKDRVLQLRDALNDVYASYLHRNNERLGQQARALAPHLPKALARIYSGLRGGWFVVKLASHPYNTRSKGKKKMAYKNRNESDNDEGQNQMTSQETMSIEEVRALRQQIAEMYEA